MNTVSRALLSVSDKTGLVEFAAELNTRKIELVSTGGTAAAIRAAGIPVVDVSEKTGFPEIMAGRVKTLHPGIHGGLLGRSGIDESVMDEHGIEAIDLLVVNLYPFERTISRTDTSYDDAIENIDIGGPAMIRAAAKNHARVTTIVDADDYETVLGAIDSGGIGEDMRRRLAAKAFTHTAAYDSAICGFLNDATGRGRLTERFNYGGQLADTLRYGENPHQKAAFYKDSGLLAGTLGAARKLQGKELSYNNIADSDAALQCVQQFSEPACVIVKHANPCGVAVAASIGDAYDRAYRTDPTSAFGGIIAVNRELDAVSADLILERQFVEVIVAPAVSDAAAVTLSSKKNIRVLVTGAASPHKPYGVEMKKVSGGLLVQDVDTGVVARTDLQIVSERAPSDEELRDMLFAWQVAKYVKSNAIVFCKELTTVGIGAGQMSRVYSTRVAAMKAADEGLPLSGSAMASDAFFPFRDGLDSAAEHGIAAVIQPGGSMRDEEVIAAANEHGLAMAFTGMRHFRH